MIPVVQVKDVSLRTAARQKQGRFKWIPYLFILPHLIFFSVFLAYPFFDGLYVSFFRYDYLQPDTNVFVGLQNYINLFMPGSITYQEFWNALGNTIEFVIYSVPLLVVIPLVLAVLLNIKFLGRNVYRTIYFAPWVLSVAVVGLLWFWIFQSEGGLINYYLTALHIDTPQWLSSMPWAWVAIVVATVWWTMGFNMIIFLAALQDIPAVLHEAAAIDGANSLQRFFSVTLPLLRPVLVLIITITIIASFNLFGQPFIMTNGGPAQSGGGGATEPIMLRIYIEGFVRHFVGSAAAMSFVVATIMIVVSSINFRVFRTRE